MLPRPIDDKFIKVIMGNQANRGLVNLKVQLILIQVAHTLALEGITRATASEITARALKSYQLEVTASFTGQTFGNMGVLSVTSHGKNRFVLDPVQLEQLKKELTQKCEQTMANLQKAIDEFESLHQRIETLQKEWEEILALRAKERELTKLINEDHQKHLPRKEGSL
jgi:hypothetical protein